MLATILATVLLARILGVTDYGTYAFVVATVTLLAVPAVLGADRLVIRDVAVYSHTDSFAWLRGLIIRSTSWSGGFNRDRAAGDGDHVVRSGRTVDPALAALWIGLARCHSSRSSACCSRC
jgi:hypothetical protein